VLPPVLVTLSLTVMTEPAATGIDCDTLTLLSVRTAGGG
jgi:hypothetical protein